MKTAILIDDDADDLLLLQDAVKETSNSIECLTFTDPLEAMNFLGTMLGSIPDFIFLDINMPMLNGIECLQLIRAQKKFDATCVTVLSTSIPDSVVEELAVRRANYSFTKPHVYADYHQLLKKVFGSKAENEIEPFGKLDQPYLRQAQSKDRIKKLA